MSPAELEELAIWISRQYNCNFGAEGKEKVRQFVFQQGQELRDEVDKYFNELKELRGYCMITFGESHPEMKKCPNELEKDTALAEQAKELKEQFKLIVLQAQESYAELEKKSNSLMEIKPDGSVHILSCKNCEMVVAEKDAALLCVGKMREALNLMVEQEGICNDFRHDHENCIRVRKIAEDAIALSATLPTERIEAMEKERDSALMALEKMPCLNPIGHDTEYVTEDMAIDAGDRSMAGSVYREAEWQRCGSCPVCVIQQEAIANLKKGATS